MQKRSFRALSYEKKSCVVWSHDNCRVMSMLRTKWRFFSMEAKHLKKLLPRSKIPFMIYICDMILCKWKYIKRVIAVEIWHVSVIFLFSTYNHGKNRTTFENLKTPSCSAHHYGQIFVNNWEGYWKKWYFVGHCNIFQLNREEDGKNAFSFKKCM